MRCICAPSSRQRSAFTLLELLSVLIIIGLIAGIGLPALKGMGKTQNDISAQRQLLDDFARARQMAIANRSEVYMVFVPATVFEVGNPDYIDPTKLGKHGGTIYSNLLASQFRGYALLSQRRVGDQPGQHAARYLTEWRTLPEGIFISTNKFWKNNSLTADNPMVRFETNTLPFPLSTNISHNVPMIVFTGTGGLNTNIDAIIPLARGSIFYARDANGKLIPGRPDIVENLRSNSTAVYSHIRIDWLTGRAHVEQQEIQ